MKMEEKEEEHEVDCAVETLIRAEEIKKDPELMAKVLERTKEKQQVLKSIAGLRKKAAEVLSKPSKGETDPEFGDDPELRTEEDKAMFQEKRRIDGKIKEMGLKNEDE
jgi:hypothetical protein